MMKVHKVLSTEALTQWCPVKNVFLKNSQNSQENTCARVSLLIKMQTHLFYRTILAAAYVNTSDLTRLMVSY